jgi:hypothetical protein
MALTRADLDEAHCGVPGCTHDDHDRLFLVQKCHPRSGVEVSYDRRDGLLRLRCRRCLMPISEIEVARAG